MPIIEIVNPAPGGSQYTSVRKAHEFVSRGRAVLEYGMLRFIDPMTHKSASDQAEFWNGSPKPKISRKVNPNRTYDPDCGPIVPMHRPGEVRS